MWERLSPGSVANRVEQQIMQAIDSGRLSPGDRLPPEREFAELLGVSRPTVREAIGALKARGVVRVVHGRGVFIAEPETTRELREALATRHHSISELFAMREVLEVPAAGWAAERQDAEALQRVADVLKTMKEVADQVPRDFDRLQELDAAFHLAIVEAAGNKFLQQTLGVLQRILNEGMQTTLMVPGRVEKSREDHQRILDALLAGDPDAARQAALSHVHAARATALQRLEERAGSQS
ncbi:FadR/GntR family transcriptional regulator [Saccharopolyspora phatthalungensis]|uniref:GntR family transcriptional repressor for pyruvate dehydrogenase complex n=1 Tax=Saccharopolyspora phatthalungensis TaxID=664693 RepID=A0A840QJ67_9PSEU|nr:FadR/GntR family transcriptional regulator [Saccharopolyspora phatthalungensis]MBB5157663.1 GntR family transcriptional repressor for pyruvate dehydrogenase complex [Saccharopolyspora phatthalungensis]